MDTVDLRTGRRSIGSFLHVPNGTQSWRPETHLPRHKHTEKYASLVLSGGYEEYGIRGRITAVPGNVLMHGAFDTHLDRVFISGATVLNLSLPGLGGVDHALGNVNDPDAIARLAETDSAAALGLLQEQFTPTQVVPKDWPDLLATDLIDDPNRRLEDWATDHNLAPATVSRGFSRAFGVSPRAFRAEIRAKRAFDQVIQGTEVLSKVLERSGFYDAAHLSRSVRALTGASPMNWITSGPLKLK